MSEVSSSSSQRPGSSGYRHVSLGQAGVQTREQGGFTYLQSEEPLGDYPPRVLDRLLHWALNRPDQTFVARRGADGQWQHISYQQMLERSRALAQNLLRFGLSAEHPLVILSGNDLEHIQLACAALYAGIPFCPVSPAYSTVSRDFAKLRHIVQALEPGLVFASDASQYSRAIEAVVPKGTPLIFTTGTLAGHDCDLFSNLLLAPHSNQADAAFAAIGPATIAKFLFTSGSTKNPKGVITTQGMLSANQQMLLQTFPVFAQEPPVLVDWLPWNHTFGGSHNVGIVLYNGGTLYIDDGKPTPQLFDETLRNLKDVSPTAYLTVPKGWEDLVTALEQDAELREHFFARVKLFFFAGAGLSQAVWNRLDKVAQDHCGERIRMMAGLGMTETAPSCTFTTGPLSVAGYIGLPAPGCEVKLAPVDGKLEVRFRGPHVMPGYWRLPAETGSAFDDEGFYRSGDAVRFADPNNPRLGLMFDGRIAEDFKLSSGVFISVGPLRARIILAGAPYVQDVLIAAPDRERLGILIFPRMAECRMLAGLDSHALPEDIVASQAVRDWVASLLKRLNEEATGSASRIDWAYLLAEVPSIDSGEITDKGSINQRIALERRAARLDDLYAGRDSAIIHA
ncbi:feruloyl-CoA synthase [Pseudomonas sp. NPDC096950]|uniref:feruloyl-CoA synthase n=1 Tax=Pseudomonas sp. NPDC096950 TaxID=3364485 RepID=UPI00383A488C